MKNNLLGPMEELVLIILNSYPNEVHTQNSIWDRLEYSGIRSTPGAMDSTLRRLVGSHKITVSIKSFSVARGRKHIKTYAITALGCQELVLAAKRRFAVKHRVAY